MRLQVLLIMCVTVLVAAVTAQRRCNWCRQGACPPRCTGERNIGTNCNTARPRRMWYYDANSRTCRSMQHLGCGGNDNRWCSKFACDFRCVRILG